MVVTLKKDVRPALEGLLAGLSRDQLQSLLLKLAELEPSLISTIEKQLLTPRPSECTSPSLVLSVRRKRHERVMNSAMTSIMGRGPTR